ncbi:MAG: hypothetical protein RR444_04410 [Oscillospiraceae bacterium]
MEVTNIIINVSISLVVGGGAGFCAFKWLGKRCITHIFDKDLERYKNQLKKEYADYNSTLEEKSKTVQHKLNIQLENLKIQLTPLQTKRLEAIHLVYVDIVKMYEGIMMLTAKFKPTAWGDEQHQLTLINEARANLVKTWVANKLFFSKELAETVDKFIREVFFKSDEYVGLASIIQTDLKFLWEERVKISDDVAEQLPKILEDIEQQFREVLGADK